MTESLQPQEPPRILEITPDEHNRNEVSFSISSPDVRGSDVLATLDYLYGDTDKKRNAISTFLTEAIETEGALSGRVFNFAVQLSEQATLKHVVEFGEKPTYLDCRNALESIFGKAKIPNQERFLLSQFVDEGRFRGKRPNGSERKYTVKAQNNELLAATDDDIAKELAALTRKYRDGETDN